MSLSREIVATYRGPGAVMRRLLAQGPREDRALMFIMAACALFFVAQLPAQARQAHLDGVDPNPLMGGALLGWLVLAPLLFYGLAALSHLVARVFGGRGTVLGTGLGVFILVMIAVVLTVSGVIGR